jgi:hypothetical protein
MKLGLVFACALAELALAALAGADEGAPVVVSYTAPSECASDEAFVALLQGQLSRQPPTSRPWRFQVKVHRREEGDYEGTLTFASGERVMHAPACDDLVEALSLVIAMATPETVTPEPPVPLPPTPAVAVPVAAPALVAPPSLLVESPSPEPDRPAGREESSTEWRVGARVQDWTNGAWLSAVGPTITGSVEPHWGRYRMMFELGGGVLQSNFYPPGEGETSITWAVVDFQACPLDLELVPSLSLIGCTRVAGAINEVHTGDQTGQSGAIWFGGGGRLRWQSPWHVYVEGHTNGLWGTQSSPLSGSPGWIDFGGSVGVRI